MCVLSEMKMAHSFLFHLFSLAAPVTCAANFMARLVFSSSTPQTCRATSSLCAANPLAPCDPQPRHPPPATCTSPSPCAPCRAQRRRSHAHRTYPPSLVSCGPSSRRLAAQDHPRLAKTHVLCNVIWCHRIVAIGSDIISIAIRLAGLLRDG